MARIAHVVCAEAAEESNGTTVLAFPVDLDAAVCLTRCLTSTDLLEKAILAEKIFFLGLALLSVGHLLFTVDETSEVRLLATVALIEGSAVVCKLLGLAVINVTLSDKSFIVEDSLAFSVLECFPLNMLFKGNERTELAGNRLGYTRNVNLLLTAGAVHKGESDLERGPFVLKKLNDAICMEDMTAREFGASFSSKLAGVADRAQLVFIYALKMTGGLGAVNIQAREAAMLLDDSLAGVATLFKSLFTEGNCWPFLFCFSVLISRVDLNEVIIFDLESW